MYPSEITKKYGLKVLKRYKIRKYCEAGSYRYLISTHPGFDVLTDERSALFLHIASP